MAGLEPSAPPPADEPWRLGPEPVYRVQPDHGQALRGLVDAPSHIDESQREWHEHRKRVLREWGQKREAAMHRPPLWCMDQLCSGSGLFPPRHLSDDWFSADELQMISQLERMLQQTGHAAALARDMMALRIFDVDVRIIADDSGSMSCGMLGGWGGGGWGGPGWTPQRVQQVFGRRAFRPASLEMFSGCPFPPTAQRWDLLRDALAKWEGVFGVLGMPRRVYRLNAHDDPRGDLDRLLARGPGGGTPMGAAMARVLSEYRRDGQDRPLLILALTDGEANDKNDFNAILDEIQDGLHGDVQVCLMGLSLEPEDIEWFEDEECDDTRIRTIEAWEVEQQMILYRKVIPRAADYNFEMHTYRALVTNFFPADYDYEAPIQTLRHRLYITLHALDRRFTGQRDAQYPSALGMGARLGANFNASLGAPGAPSQIVPVVAAAGVVAGGLKLGCLGGLLAYAYFASGGPGSRAGPPAAAPAPAGQAGDEAQALSGADEEAVGAIVESWQRQSLQGRETRFGGTYGGNRWPRRPAIDPWQLRLLQQAIGTLSPAEAQMRDLQFQDVVFNGKALEAALGCLRQASAALR